VELFNYVRAFCYQLDFLSASFLSFYLAVISVCLTVSCFLVAIMSDCTSLPNTVLHWVFLFASFVYSAVETRMHMWI